MDQGPQSSLVDLMARTALKNYDRGTWRSAVVGDERESLQGALLKLVSGDFPGTEKDLLNVLKAAHAVLPLQGSDQRRLAGLLAKHTDGILDWLDVFVEVLAQQDVRSTHLPGKVLQVLHDFLMAETAVISTDMRFIVACRQIRDLGYQPRWLTELLHKETRCKTSSVQAADKDRK